MTDMHNDLDDPADYVESRCVVCGELIDYCQGHGEMGDPHGYQTQLRHDLGDHTECDSLGCDQAGDVEDGVVVLTCDGCPAQAWDADDPPEGWCGECGSCAEHCPRRWQVVMLLVEYRPRHDDSPADWNWATLVDGLPGQAELVGSTAVADTPQDAEMLWFPQPPADGS